MEQSDRPFCNPEPRRENRERGIDLSGCGCGGGGGGDWEEEEARYGEREKGMAGRVEKMKER